MCSRGISTASSTMILSSARSSQRAWARLRRTTADIPRLEHFLGPSTSRIQPALRWGHVGFLTPQAHAASRTEGAERGAPGGLPQVHSVYQPIVDLDTGAPA